jgi:hypothetical protein
LSDYLLVSLRPLDGPDYVCLLWTHEQNRAMGRHQVQLEIAVLGGSSEHDSVVVSALPSNTSPLPLGFGMNIFLTIVGGISRGLVFRVNVGVVLGTWMSTRNWEGLGGQGPSYYLS